MFFAAYITALASAFYLDTSLKPKLLISSSIIKSCLKAVISTLAKGRLAYLFRCAVILFFLFIFYLTSLISLGPVVLEVVLGLLLTNWPITLGMIITSLIVSFWSFSQSLFFVKLAVRLTNYWGMLYLFISDIILSTLIFITCLAGFLTLVDIMIPDQDKISVDIIFSEYCDPECLTRGNFFYKNEKLETLLYYISPTNNINDLPQSLMLDEIVDSATIIPVSLDNFTETELKFFEDRNRTPRYKLKLEMDFSDYQVTIWNTYTFLLKKQFDEIWRHFRFNFNYYSFQQFKYGKYDLRSTHVFSDFEELGRSNVLKTLVPDQNKRETLRKFILRENIEDLKDFIDNDILMNKNDWRSFYALVKFQSSKWYLASRILSNDYFKYFSNSDYRRFMSDPNLRVLVGDGVVKAYFFPMTTFWLASISFSSLFFLFIISKVIISVISAKESNLRSKLCKYPLTVFIFFIVPIPTLINIIL